MVFKKEAEFEEALIKTLTEHGWEKEILRNPSEEDLKKNWANILFENNRSIDRLNDYPLTDSEMNQIMEQIINLRTPLKLNGFINGGSVAIKRDNPDDKAHYGKEVSLKIYNRREIAAGQSRYQIAQQPKFPTKSKILNDRRGDVMLLINGMPVIHIELKKNKGAVKEACTQIEKYSKEGIFNGLFSLVQLFVAMEPNETKYFANPGPEGKFNSSFYFHWADFYNEPINDWHKLASSFLSIPMAHQMIGFYTVADNADGVLKVLRSYQYIAANAISDKVAKNNWEESNQLGGYIWHTTGSGKTMTSFKSAQLIASSKDADKVIFLMDRIELGTQSLKEYRGFAEENEDVQQTEDTQVLVNKLKSDDPANTLIVTSIQKMSNIGKEDDGLKDADIQKMNKKRIVFIVDECHRSTFGDMLITIKKTFPKSLFFGFSGTPIQDENQKKLNTTSDVFGDELHRYSIADGIRDHNVLAFDPYKVLTFKDRDVRQAVALSQAKAASEEDIFDDEKKEKIYYKFMNEVPLVGYKDEEGKYQKGIEDYVPKSQYLTREHQEKVVEDIIDGWSSLSRNGKLHGIFATSSIVEAIEYYRLLKEKAPHLKVTALFDPNIDNQEGFSFKEDGLVEIIEDYNNRYFGSVQFTIPTWQRMKKDIAARLAHKEVYKTVERNPEKQLDLLIVVDQMLTGFDSKWVNTLYMDKTMAYENIIQAFSRTNRLLQENLKPHGTIKYYRYPHTMEKNIDDAVTLYSGDKAFGLFVNKIHENIHWINLKFEEITLLFRNAGIQDFEKLPEDDTEKSKFAKIFNELNEYLDAAKIQGLTFNKKEYKSEDKEGNVITSALNLSEKEYLILVKRYQELPKYGGSGDEGDSTPFNLKGYITEIDTGKIDTDFMNSRFEKYRKLLEMDEATKEEIEKAKQELHSTFATLTQDEQKYANIFLHEIERGEVKVDSTLSFRDYINQYLSNAKNDQIHEIATKFGLDESLLREMVELNITEEHINDFGRFDNLIGTVNKDNAKAYLEEAEGVELSKLKVNQKTKRILRRFILEGIFEIEL